MNQRLENIVTMIVAAIVILALFYMSRSWHALWAMLFLLNLNTTVAIKGPSKG